MDPLGEQRVGRFIDFEEISGQQLEIPFYFYFFKFNFYPSWHPYGQAGWLSTTQVLKGSLLPESGIYEKEKQRKSFVTTSLGMN